MAFANRSVNYLVCAQNEYIINAIDTNLAEFISHRWSTLFAPCWTTPPPSTAAPACWTLHNANTIHGKSFLTTAARTCTRAKRFIRFDTDARSRKRFAPGRWLEFRCQLLQLPQNDIIRALVHGSVGRQAHTWARLAAFAYSIEGADKNPKREKLFKLDARCNGNCKMPRMLFAISLAARNGLDNRLWSLTTARRRMQFSFGLRNGLGRYNGALGVRLSTYMEAADGLPLTANGTRRNWKHYGILQWKSSRSRCTSSKYAEETYISWRTRTFVCISTTVHRWK